MGAGHTVTAIYELVPAQSDEGGPSVDPLKYQANKPSKGSEYNEELLTIKVRYKKPEGSKSILMEKPFAGKVGDIDEASENLRFSASVAGFGMLLRESDYSGTFNADRVIRLAKGARGYDADGYRSEFIRLAEIARDMKLIE